MLAIAEVNRDQRLIDETGKGPVTPEARDTGLCPLLSVVRALVALTDCP